MLPHRFDQVRPFATLGIILLAWAVLPLVVKTFTRTALFEIQAPLAVAESHVADLQTFWSNRMHSKDELLVAGRETAGLIAQYSFSVQQNEHLKAEILRLENLLRIPAQPEYRFEHARVARRDFSGWWQRMIIRKGRDHGITVGAPVVYVGGVVGRISEVYRNTAVVDLVTSPTVRLAASVENDIRPLSYQGGRNPSFSTPRGRVEFVPLDVFASPQQPRRLVTSSLGGVFPAGLTIGEIIELELGADGLFKSGEVRLDPRLGELTEVTVLVPLNPE